MKKAIITVILLLLRMIPVEAASPDDILGVWNTEQNDAKVEIFKCGEKFCGKIVWLKDPTYPPNSKEGTPGTPKFDHNNPDPSLRSRPVMGLQLMTDFVNSGNNVWKDGKLYDPEKGKAYSGKMTLVSPTELDLRGFIGISLLGRTSKWTR